MSSVFAVAAIAVVAYAVRVFIWHWLIEPAYDRRPAQPPPLPHIDSELRFRRGELWLFNGCVIALVAAVTLGFVPLWPWGLDGALLLFVWRGLGMKPVRRDLHDALVGDVYVVGEVPRSYLERGHPGWRWLVKPPPRR
jgi:hypothetical protein